MSTPSQVLETLTDDARSWLADAETQVRSDAAKHLPVLLPQLPRRLGRNPFVASDSPANSGGSMGGESRVDMRAWRACDAGAVMLFDAGKVLGENEDASGLVLDLYYHGDMEEKTMVFRAMACMPLGETTVTLLGEAQRTNTSNHFEAAVCDSDLLVRAVGQPGFGLDEFNRVILKLAFVDLPLARVLGACSRANEELSRMVQDLATEREAAGRRVWRDTNLLIAHAPTTGSIARLAGGLEHGDDAHRLSAAMGLQQLHNDFLLELARERLDREPVAAIRDAIRDALS